MSRLSRVAASSSRIVSRNQIAANIAPFVGTLRTASVGGRPHFFRQQLSRENINSNAHILMLNSDDTRRGYSTNKHDTMRGTFMDTVSTQAKQALATDEGVQKLKEQFAADPTVQKLMKMGAAAKQVGKSVGELLDKSALALAQRTQVALDNKFVAATFDTASKAKEKAAEGRLVKFVMDEYFVSEQEKWEFHYHFRSGEGRKVDAKKGQYYNPYTKQMESMEGVTINEEETGVTVYDPSMDGARRRKQKLSGMKRALEIIASKTEGSNNPLATATRRIVDSTKGAVDRLGDAMFVANEQTEALQEFFERNDSFDLDTFTKDVEYIMIPKLVQAFFEDDADTLRYYVTDECWRSQLHPRVQSRITDKVRFDTVILDIQSVEVQAIRYIADSPVIVVGCSVQYIYCIKDNLGKGEIVEGAMDDIRKESLFITFRQDPSEETNDFEILDFSFGGSIRIT